MTHTSAYSPIIGSTCEMFTHSALQREAASRWFFRIRVSFPLGSLIKTLFLSSHLLKLVTLFALGFSSQATYRLSSPADLVELVGLYATDCWR